MNCRKIYVYNLVQACGNVCDIVCLTVCVDDGAPGNIPVLWTDGTASIIGISFHILSHHCETIPIYLNPDLDVLAQF